MKVLCVLALAIVLAPPCLALPSMARSLPGQLHNPSASCETCIDVVQDFEDYMLNPATQDKLVYFIQNDICDLLPSDTAQTCSQEARVMVAQAMASMEQEFPPRKVCDYLGACEPGLPAFLQQTATAVGGPVECPLCKLFLSTLVQKLRDPDSRASIEASAHDACESLQGDDAIQKCLGDVTNLFSSLDALLSDMDVSRACQVAQYCSSEEGLALTPPPAALSQLRLLLLDLTQRPAVMSPESCQACEEVVEQADAILMVRWCCRRRHRPVSYLCRVLA